MSVVIRGVKNAFRSGIRATAVILILAISMGLALAMLLANQAVKDRLESVRHSVGTTITVNPAGSRGFEGGGEPLTTDDITKVEKVAHVASVNAVLNLTATTTGANSGNFRVFGGGQKSGETNLESSTDPGTLGKRLQSRGESVGGGTVKIDGDAPPIPENFKLPIRIAGITGNQSEDGQTIQLTEGRQLATNDTNSALVGKKLAEKNSLHKGSTFTLYSETFTVVGIFDNGTEFGNDSLYIPLATAQRISEADKEISSAIVKVDSVDNLKTAESAIASTLGTDKADVAATEESAITAVDSLRAVQRVSLIGFVIALAAAAIIIFLTMLMIVRERRREIGVLKAIGGSNRSIVTQFVVEAMVLVLISSFVGMGVAAASSNSIASALVKSNTSNSTTADDAGPSISKSGPGGGGFRTFRVGGPGASVTSATDLIGNVTTNVRPSTLGYGLLAAIGIAILGSAIPAWFVTKVRPAEVLRGE